MDTQERQLSSRAGEVTILDAEAVRALVTRADALAAVREAFAALAEGRAVLPDELAMALEGAGELHVKGAHLLGSRWLSFKVATGFPGNAERGLPANSGFTAVLDAATGRPAALLMDGGWLTEIRTAAAGALAADLLARADARVAGVLGTGAQARFQLAALREVRPIEHVLVWGRDRTRAEACAADLAREGDGCTALAVETPEQAVRGADVLVCATASRAPLVEAAWLRPGTHVTAMGADRPEKQELAVDVMAAADRVVADRVAVCERVGELRHALAAGALDDGDADELADVVAGRRPGRVAPEEITVADLCGLGVQDAAMADLVLRRHGSA